MPCTFLVKNPKTKLYLWFFSRFYDHWNIGKFGFPEISWLWHARKGALAPPCKIGIQFLKSTWLSLLCGQNSRYLFIKDTAVCSHLHYIERRLSSTNLDEPPFMLCVVLNIFGIWMKQNKRNQDVILQGGLMLSNLSCKRWTGLKFKRGFNEMSNPDYVQLRDLDKDGDPSAT